MILNGPGGLVWGITWGADDRIVYDTTRYPGLMQISAWGGESRPMTFPQPGEVHKQADFLPDGDAIVFTIGERGPPPESRTRSP